MSDPFSPDYYADMLASTDESAPAFSGERERVGRHRRPHNLRPHRPAAKPRRRWTR